MDMCMYTVVKEENRCVWGWGWMQTVNLCTEKKKNSVKYSFLIKSNVIFAACQIPIQDEARLSNLCFTSFLYVSHIPSKQNCSVFLPPPDSPTLPVPSCPVLSFPGFAENWALLARIGNKRKETDKCPSNRTLSMGGRVELREESAHLFHHWREKLCQDSMWTEHFSECLKNSIMQPEETVVYWLAGSEHPSESVQTGEVKWLLVGKNETKDKKGPEDNHVLTPTKHCLHGVPSSSRSNSISSSRTP